MMYQFTLMKIAYIYFFYGLSFFVMGLAIFLQDTQFRKIAMLRNTRWLGAFGVTHGLTDWAVMFTTLKYFLGVPANLLLNDYACEVVLYFISFGFLYEYGIKRIVGATRLRWLQWVLLGTCGLWLVNMAVMVFTPHKNVLLWLQMTEEWSRYLVCFPGAVLAGVGFLGKRGQVASKGAYGIKHAFFGTSFIFYGVVAGLTAFSPSFFPAKHLDLRSLNIITVGAIPVLRLLAGLFMAYFIVRVVGIFNNQHTQLLQTAERELALSGERDRISRDLHDGVLQALYAIGLQMEEAAHLTRESPDRAGDMLARMIDRVDDIIRDIRFFIRDLRLPQSQEGDIVKRLRSQLERFSAVTRVPVELFGPEREMTGNLSLEQADHLYYIVQEALVNVAKHADASQVYVDMVVGKDELQLSVVDDGNGMRESRCDMVSVSGHGMENIRSRVTTLGGWCRWESNEGLGTRLKIVIPLTDGK